MDGPWSRHAGATRTREFDELCLQLNVDAGTQTAAWQLWQHISSAVAVDDQPVMPWLACCLYLASKPSLVAGAPGAGGAMGVSMQSLLQASNLTPMEFYETLEACARSVDLSVFQRPAAATAAAAAPANDVCLFSN